MRLIIILIAIFLTFSQCAINRRIVEVSDFNDLADIEKFEYEYTLNEGIKYRLLEDLPRAVYFFTRSIEIYPRSDVAYFELSNIYLAAGEVDYAIEFAKKAIELDPDNKWYYFQSGMIYREAGLVDEAIEIYQAGVRRFPEELEMKFTLAAMLAMNKRSSESLKIYDELEKILGINERISIAREHIYMQNGNFELAHNEINRLIEAFPGEPRFYGVLAELYGAIGMLDEALEIYNKLFAIDPDNGMAQMSVAEFFLRAGKETESMYYLKAAFSNPTVDFNEKVGFYSAIVENNIFSARFDKQVIELGELLIERHPERNVTKLILSDLYLGSGQYDKAADLIYELYSSDKENIIYAEQLIGVINYTGNYVRIIELGETMIEAFPESLLINYFTGVAHHMTGNSDRALEVFEKAPGITEADNFLMSHIYSYMGEIFNENKDFVNSDKYFNLALETDSSNIITLNNYAYYLSLREEHLERALGYSYKTLNEDPENASFLDTYAWILYKLGQYTEAFKYIEKAYLQGGDTSFEIVKHYAAILIRLEKYEEAAEYLDRAKELAGEDEALQLDVYLEIVREMTGVTY